MIFPTNKASMNRILLILAVFLFGNSIYAQSTEKINTGGFIYSEPQADDSKSLIYCSDGTTVTILGRYRYDEKFIEVRYNGIRGFMYHSAIKNSDKISKYSDSPKIEISKKDTSISNDKKTKNSDNVLIIPLNKTAGNIYKIPCKLNGLKMDFVFDTGASEVSISLTEALFMFKNGYLKESDITGTQNYSIANGDIVEGTTIIIRELEFEGIKLKNIKASISHEMKAPLLLGQSALSQLGIIQIDYKNDILTIIKD